MDLLQIEIYLTTFSFGNGKYKIGFEVWVSDLIVPYHKKFDRSSMVAQTYTDHTV